MKIHLIWVSLSVFLYPLYPVPQTSGNALVALGFWLGTSGVMAGPRRFGGDSGPPVAMTGPDTGALIWRPGFYSK